MKLMITGVLAMSLFTLSACKTIYHKRTTGDHDRDQYASITSERISAIRLGVTTRNELRSIFDKQECHQWTYRKPFWITWEGKKYKVDQALSYLEIREYEPEDRGHMTVYGWKEQRFVRAYLYNGIVQLYIVSHLARDERGNRIKGPLANYPGKPMLKLELMNGLGCDREIYNVVSLGRKPFDPEEFDKYCRPLIIEDEEK